MWIFTKYGFNSVVSPQEDDGDLDRQVDPSRVMVRCRLREHIEALKERFPDLIADYDIKESSRADYAFRMLVDKRVWSQLLLRLNDELEYDNFKSEVARFRGDKDTAYVDSLHEVWSVMHTLQERAG